MDIARALFCTIALAFLVAGLLATVVPVLLAAIPPSFAFPAAFLAILVVLMVAVPLVVALARRASSS